MTKCQVDKMPFWQKGKLTFSQVEKMASWKNVKMTKWQVDKMPFWQKGKLTKWYIDKMASWQNDVTAKKLSYFTIHEKNVLSNAKYLEKVAIMKHNYPSFSIKKYIC